MSSALVEPEILAADNGLKTTFEQACVKAGCSHHRRSRRIALMWADSHRLLKGSYVVAWRLKDITPEAVKRFRKKLASKGTFTAHVLFKGNLPARAVADRIALLDVRDEKRLLFTGEDEDVFAARLLAVLYEASDENGIVDAWWEEDTLVVASATKKGFKRLRVALDKLPVLQGMTKAQRDQFEIDEDGAFIYWPSHDIHLGWEQFGNAVDKAARLKIQQETVAFNQAYGAAIKGLRKESDLRQSDIQGLTARQVGRIEAGECRATLSAIRKFASAHKMDTSEYMDELAKRL
jgi:hypothetical protein